MTAAANPRAGGVDPLEPAGSTQAASYQRLRAHLATRGLTAAGETLTEVLDAARTEDLTLIAALERLLATEVAAAAVRRHAGLLRIAALPAPSTLDDFDFTAQPGVDEKLIGELACRRFLDDAGTILLVGQPSTGTTMLAIGLARAAIDAGHRVSFTTAAELAKRCRRAAAEGRWATTIRFYCGPKLLVIDEFADARHNPDPAANAALFEVISRRYLRSSTILTSHAGIASWGQRLGDPMLAASLLDRLLHRGVLVAIDGRPTGCAPTSNAPKRCAGR
jgi:DNA replication protein DnaC